MCSYKVWYIFTIGRRKNGRNGTPGGVGCWWYSCTSFVDSGNVIMCRGGGRLGAGIMHLWHLDIRKASFSFRAGRGARLCSKGGVCFVRFPWGVNKKLSDVISYWEHPDNKAHLIRLRFPEAVVQRQRFSLNTRMMSPETQTKKIYKTIFSQKSAPFLSMSVPHRMPRSFFVILSAQQPYRRPDHRPCTALELQLHSHRINN